MEGKLNDIRQALKCSPRKSICKLAQMVVNCKTSAFRATELLKLKPYKITIVHEIHAANLLRRVLVTGS